MATAKVASSLLVLRAPALSSTIRASCQRPQVRRTVVIPAGSRLLSCGPRGRWADRAWVLRPYTRSMRAQADSQQQQQQNVPAEQTGQKEDLAVQHRRDTDRGDVQLRRGGTDRGDVMALSPLADVLDMWDPFFAGAQHPLRSMRKMVNAMDKLFDEFSFTPAARGALGPPGGGLMRAPFELRETDDGFHVRLDVPGLSKEEISVTLDDETKLLSVTGEHSEEKKKDERFASSYGRYETRLQLPDSIAADKINAELKDGVLTISVPKKEEAKKEPITININ